MFYCCGSDGSDGVRQKKAEFYQKRLERGMEWDKKNKAWNGRSDMNTEDKFNDRLIRLRSWNRFLAYASGR